MHVKKYQLYSIWYYSKYWYRMGKIIASEKFYFVSFKILNEYKIDLIATWTLRS